MADYLLMGDIHLSDTPPKSCFDSYQDDIFDILHQSVLLAAERGVRAVIWAGDIFDNKVPIRTKHATVRRLIELARTYPCPVYAVPGNHDLSHDRLESIQEGQPLGVLLASGAVRMLDGWMNPYDLRDDSLFVDPVYGAPWLGTFDDDTVTAAMTSYRELVSDHQPSLVVAHAPLYPTGLELPYENYPAVDWADAMENTGSVYYGHVHEAAGIFVAGGVVFCNPGAISRGSLHEHNLSRKVSCAIWNSGTGNFEIVELPHKPAEQVFRLDQINEEKQLQLNLDDFLTSIGASTIRITTIESVMQYVRELELGPELEEVVRDLLAGVPA